MAVVYSLAGEAVLSCEHGVTVGEILDIAREELNVHDDHEVVLSLADASKVYDPTDMLIHGEGFEDELDQHATVMVVKQLTEKQRQDLMNATVHQLSRVALNDTELMTALVAQSGLILERVSKRLCDDRVFVQHALLKSPHNFPHVSPRLRADKGLVRQVLQHSALAFKHVTGEAKEDEEICFLAMEKLAETRHNLFIKGKRLGVPASVIQDIENDLSDVQDQIHSAKRARHH